MQLKNFLSYFILLSLISCLVNACRKNEPPHPVISMQLVSVTAGDFSLDLNNQDNNTAIPVDQPITLTYSSKLDTTTIRNSVQLMKGDSSIQIHVYTDTSLTTFSIKSIKNLEYNTPYLLVISDQLKGESGESFPGFNINFSTIPPTLTVTSVLIAGDSVKPGVSLTDIPLKLNIDVTFSNPLNKLSIDSHSVTLMENQKSIPLDYAFSNGDKNLIITSSQKLDNLSKYKLTVTSNVSGADGEILNYFSVDFYTTYDSVPVNPVISDEDLLTLIQKQTFKYFWDFGHPVSGMARERNSSGDVVTTGGSGFGIMAIIVGMDRGFITRQDGVERINKIVDFLGTADRFHGAWPHWMDGSTGKVIPFSTMDDGGDLVETSYMAMGLLTARQYLNPEDSSESQLIDKINTLWKGIEWTWYTQGGQNVLYWHWSPDFGWAINMPIRGYDEALITYVLAASSPTFGVDADVYHDGWANSSTFTNGNSYYGYTLPLGPAYGGPLFFEQYTYMGLDPDSLSDEYADYKTQTLNHTLINRAYCIENPKQYIGYGPQCWGLTASDNDNGYSAQSPTNDSGVITPTAALSSFPYTPEYSMEALHFFYYTLGDRLWGDYGFYDAFNLNTGWTANSYLAIDEGPIIVMIENYRTGLLWNLFMSCPEVQAGLNKLGFKVN